MHGHTLPLKRAFVAPADARTRRREAALDQRENTDGWNMIYDERTRLAHCLFIFIFISSQMPGL